MPDARFSEDFWTDPKIRKLDHETQRLFIYLFTNPHRNYCGLYYLPKSFMSEQTGISDKGIDRGIHTLIDRGMIEYSESYQVVFVKNMLKRQAGGMPHFLNNKQIKGIENHLGRLHGCPLIKSFINHYNLINIKVSYTPMDTPISFLSDTPMDAQSQSQSKKDNNIPKISKKLISLPQNFTISDEVRQYAVKNNFTHLDEHLEAFILYAKSNGKRYQDWDSAFKRAIRENWGKIDLTKPEISRAPALRTVACKVCKRWIEKCICKEAKDDSSPRSKEV